MDFNASRNDAVGLVAVEECAWPGAQESRKLRVGEDLGHSCP